MDSEKVNILLVDDQPGKLLSYEAILGELGENLIKTNSGYEALEHLLKTEVAVVLVDVHMPQMDGFELASLIRQHPRYENTAIIFISALHLTNLDQLKGYKTGAVDYVTVPIEPQLLRARVAVFVDLYRKTKTLARINLDLERRVAERKRLEKALRGSAERLSIIQDRAPVGICEATLDGCLLRVNDEFCRIIGYRREELLRHRFQDITYPDDADAQMREYRRVQAGEIPSCGIEQRFLHKDGSIIWIDLHWSVVRNGRASFGIGVIQDITERKRAEKDLVHLANYDALTALPNRALFMDRLHQALARALRYKQKVAVLFMDLDGFKHVNDTLGHDGGDLLLKAIAQRLVATVLRASDSVARIGGDEFALMLTDIAHTDDVNRIAQEIVEVLSKPLELLGNELFITTSVGVSLYPRDGLDAHTLLKAADMAMYLAKKHGNRYQHYSPRLGAKASRRFTLGRALRRALARHEFVLHYQPQFQLASGRIHGVEALLRWRPPDSDRLVSPMEFIPLAEESGMILPIAEWVLLTAASQMQAWHAQGLTPVRLAVNVSALQFQRKNMKKVIDLALHETGFDHSFLELELTESILQTAKAERMLSALRRTGIKIVLDDFGTGFSSLSYLKRFPVHRLKIDRSFTRGLPKHRNNAAISTAIVAMAHSLKLEVTAEGVETVEQLNFLRSLHCDAVQGNLVGEPLPAEDIAGLLTRKAPSRALA
ncbi:MAG: GGDEF/EAL domain-containing response regulator [Gammaproteobacteria bacterium]